MGPTFNNARNSTENGMKTEQRQTRPETQEQLEQPELEETKNSISLRAFRRKTVHLDFTPLASRIMKEIAVVLSNQACGNLPRQPWDPNIRTENDCLPGIELNNEEPQTDC